MNNNFRLPICLLKYQIVNLFITHSLFVYHLSHFSKSEKGVHSCLTLSQVRKVQKSCLTLRKGCTCLRYPRFYCPEIREGEFSILRCRILWFWTKVCTSLGLVSHILIETDLTKMHQIFSVLKLQESKSKT